eukprot:COSAG03_NODE_2220_length_2991_cov_2.080221_3_plen_85_part_00
MLGQTWRAALCRGLMSGVSHSVCFMTDSRPEFWDGRVSEVGPFVPIQVSLTLLQLITWPSPISRERLDHAVRSADLRARSMVDL